MPLTVLRTPDRLAPVRDVALGPALLARVAGAAGDGEDDALTGRPLLRVTRPAPTLAFSGLDALSPQYPDAAAAAAAHGFTPVLRARGGRAAAYHDGCLLIDHVGVEPDARMHIRRRFDALVAVLVQALAELGVAARVGALPGEYCPGDHSLHAALPGGGGAVKLVGTAQRVVRDAWLVSAMVVMSGERALREVLSAVYAGLGLAWDPATVGSVAGVRGGAADRDLGDAVETAVLSAYAHAYPLVTGDWATLGPGLLAEAEALVSRHDGRTRARRG